MDKTAHKEPAEESRSAHPVRRRRGLRTDRLRRAVTVLIAAGLAGTAVGVVIYQATRPATRRPGEELPEITRKLRKNLPADAPQPRFSDVTARAGLDGFRTFAGPRTSQLPEDMGSGAAWGDFDGDGDDDLFLVSAGGALDLPRGELAPSELYENLGDGTFRKVTSFPDTRIHGMAAAWGDYDSDGRPDLVVSGYNSLLLFHNEEAGFVRDPGFPEPPGFWAGATWGDFDNDRDPDLYVCGYVRYVEASGEQRRVSRQYGATVPYTLNPAAFEPERNLLLRNDGDGTFTDVASALGVANPEGRSLGALWHDFDDNGWLDLYIANDISDNALYLNEGGRFHDVSLAAWVADYRGAMGLAAGDWNRDGDDDLFITHWVAQENALYDSLLRDFASGPAGERDHELAFSDRAAPLGLGQTALRFVGWGTEFGDFDGDGWLDLVVANGSTFETAEEPKRLKPQQGFFFWNQRGEYFHDLAPLDQDLAQAHVGRGLALSDYDNDGDLDLLLVHQGEGVQLLSNEMQTGNWLELRLRSRIGDSGRPVGTGDGATVIARVGGAVLRRSLTSSSYLSQSSRILHFGLGNAGRVDTLEVRWLGGGVDTYAGLAANAVWELVEGEPEARRVSAEDSGPGDTREGIALFWSRQRAAMEAMKRQGDIPRAIELFREALALNPSHGDSRYYLANCLAVRGRVDEALAELAELGRLDPGSPRAHKQWGVLRALSAASGADLEAARKSLERALALNPEETGSLLVLGEIALLQGDEAFAEQRFEWACRTNPRAVGGFFLRAYLAWKRGETEASLALLRSAREARGEEWKPEGTVAEGDVAVRMHREATPLSVSWESWDGAAEPAAAFQPLDALLAVPRGFRG